MVQSTVIYLHVPGSWKGEAEFVDAISEHCRSYKLNDGILEHLEGVGPFRVQVFGPTDAFVDDALSSTPMGMGDGDWLSVREHQSLVEINHLKNEDEADNSMTTEILVELLAAAGGLLGAGGRCVALRSSSRVYSSNAWLEIIKGAADPKLRNEVLFDSLTSIQADEEWYFSVGMNLFGRADVAVPRSLDLEEAVRQIRQVNLLQLEAGRSLEGREDLGSWGGPKVLEFSAVWDEEERFDVDHPSHNAKGLRRLRLSY
jgi:hypothetical protein